MSKRFTDTDKYKKPFTRGLKGPYKLLWDYLYHDCDHAGIWIVDFDIAQIYLGSDMPVNREDALRYFNDDEMRIIEIDSGKKWFIKPFIDFQYGELNPNNRAHKSVIDKLLKHDLIDQNNQLSIKPLERPLQGYKDKDKEMELDKDMDKDKEGLEKKSETGIVHTSRLSVVKESDSGELVNGVLIPEPLQDVENIAEAYAYYCQYLKENYSRWPTSTTTQMDLQKLVELKAEGNDPIEVIKQTIHAKNKSFYKIREDYNSSSGDRKSKFSEFLSKKGGVV